LSLHEAQALVITVSKAKENKVLDNGLAIDVPNQEKGENY
jgi:hypothetical protein